MESTEAIRHGLLDNIGGLVKSTRRSYRFRAALLWLALASSVLLIVVWLDMTVRSEEIGLRILFLLLWAAATGLTAWRWLIPAWQFSPSRFEVARWIEHAQPEIGEQLSTSLQFAETAPNDNRFGSSQFRDVVLQSWSKQADSIAWKAYLDPTSWMRPGVLLLSVLAIVAVVAAWHPQDMRRALARLFQPWATLPWPQADQLEFVNLPKAIARGQELQVEIIDLVPPLPQQIDVYVRVVDANVPSEAIAYSANNLTDVAVVTLPSMDQAIEIRALGGEDRTMPWQRIDVAQPPKLESFRFQVHPPAYTGRPDTEIVGNRIQVLARSHVRFSGRFEEAIQRVEVDVQNTSEANSLARSGERKVAVENEPSAGAPQALTGGNGSITLDDDKRSFSMLVCDESFQAIAHENIQQSRVSWRLRVTTLAGVVITAPEIWAVEILTDVPPTVVLAEQELSQISTDASLPLRGNASDDLGLSEVAMRWQIEAAETTDPGKWQLWSTSDSERTSRREFVVEHTWLLGSQIPLVAGQRLQIWLEAKDTFGQLGKSTPQTLEVRDSQDVLESIAGRQSELLEQVRSITEAQRRNSQLASRSREIILQSETVRREEVDALANVNQMQQSVNRQLNAERNSVAESLRTIQQLLANNQLADTDTAAQLAELAQRVDRLDGGSLTAAARDAQNAFEQAKKRAAEQLKLDETLRDALASSDASQGRALEELQELTDRLARSEALRVVERELSQVLNLQQALRRDTDNLEIRRLSGLSKEEFQANRAGLQADQQGLAQTLEQLVKRAKLLAEAMPADQAVLSSQIKRAVASLNDSQVGGRMRTASESIAADRFALAAETQLGIVEALRQAMQQLSTSSQRSLEGQLAQMRAASTELSELAAAQSSLAEEMASLADKQVASDAAQEVAQEAATLARQQAQLQQATASQQTRAEQVGDQRTGEKLSVAGEKQSIATAAARQQQLQSAASNARGAADDLAQVAKESEKRAEQLQREIAEQQAMQLAVGLSQLVTQQQSVVAKFHEFPLVQLSELDPELRLTKEHEIRQLASRQEAVRQMVRDVRERAQKLPAFEWTLEQAEVDMARAVAAAQRFRISPDAMTSADRALKKLEQAVQALKKNPAAPGEESTAEQPDKNQEDQANADRPAPPLASLKLLRALQTDINQETRQINENSSIMEVSERAQRVEQLSQQQQALGVQIDKLLRELEAATDSNQ